MYRVRETGFRIVREKILREKIILKTRYATDASALFEGVSLMSMRRIAGLQAGLLLLAMLANAASLKNTMRITVLDSVTRAMPLDNNGVPINCDGITFDAYCRSTTNVPLVSTLLVQEGDHPPFRISCKIESRFSRCTPLPKGATFDARKEKKGITVYFEDDKGKARRQLYTLVTGDEKATPAATAAVVATRVPSAAGNALPAPAASASVPHAAAPMQSAPAPAPAPPAVAARQISPESASAKVKCNFSSTPAGAEITVDWRYVGNTPSEIGLSPGTHVVVISMAGFTEWKRELTVGADSAVNVSANLQKTQP
jgi:PEGA domain-containing protein